MADLKALAKRFYGEVLSEGKFDVIDEIIADDFVEHQEFPGQPPGKEGLKAFATMIRTAFPDLNIKIIATATDGDELWVQAVMSGTQQGEFAGIPATGKKISITMMDRVATRDGKAIAHWGASDDLGMLTQLGVIPAMG